MSRSKKLILAITATISSLTLALVPPISQVQPLQADPGWRKSSEAVTLDNEKYVADAWIVKDGATYKMWYTHGKTNLTIAELRDELSNLNLGVIIGDLANRNLEALLNNLAAVTASDVSTS